MGSCSSTKKQKKQPISAITNQNVDQNSQNIRKTKRASTLIPILAKTAQSDTVNESVISKCSSIRVAEKLKRLNVIRQGVFRIYSVVGSKFEQYTEGLEDRSIKIIQHNVSGVKKRMEMIQKNGNKTDSLINRLQKSSLSNEYICSIGDIYQDENYYYLLSDYCSGGDLEQLKGQVNDSQVIVLLNQMLSAISYIHQKKMIHTKLALKSFHLLNNQNSLFCKLVDVSSLYENASGVRIEPSTIDYAQDVYSIGSIAYELLTGCKPYVVKKNQKDQITDKEQQQVLVFTQHTSQNLKDLLKKMLDTNIFERITIDQAKKKLLIDIKIHASQLTRPLYYLSKCKKRNYFHHCILIFMANKFFKEEEEILKNIFLQADSNQDGLLDSSELHKLYGEVISYENIQVDIKEIIEILDINNNEAIEQQEFITGALNLDELLSSTYLEACFKYLQNQYGYITSTSLRRQVEVDEEQVRDVLDNVNGSKRVIYDFILQLDYVEFSNLMRQLL